ncbi:MAG: His/Gly/Thr/Pro-type tRNA ligase C-terminal domain-containing protein, partial [Nitrospirales bacterium]
DEPELWIKTEAQVRAALEKSGVPFTEAEDEAAFYGPKIDVKIKDALGRSWQCSTIQVDFNNPDRFGLTYIGEDGKSHQPIMIHRALMGSIERFFGILLEHYGGAFPTWLAPVQAKILPISDKQQEYGASIVDKLLKAGCRAESDLRNEKIGLKIREAEKSKIPYMLVVGDRESQSATVSVRKRNGKSLGTMSVEEVLTIIQSDIPSILSHDSPRSV